MKKLITVAACLTLLALPTFAAADEQFVCAAVHPCNQDGTVQAPFDTGACAPRYRAECLSDHANNLQEKLVSCQERTKDSASQVKSLRREIRQLKRLQRAK